MRGFGAAFRFGFLSALREPALFVVFAATVLLLLLAPLGTAFGFREEESLVRDVGLSTLLLGAVFVAVVVGGAASGSRAVNEILGLRPAGKTILYAGSSLGALSAATLVNLSLSLCGFVLLRHKEIVFADRRALLLAFSVPVLAIFFGVLFNFLKRRSFSACALTSSLVLSLLAAGVAFFWSPRGTFRTTLPAEDVLLLQAELLSLSLGVVFVAAVWAATRVFGRVGGIAATWITVVFGVLYENLSVLPPYLASPLKTLLPDLGLLWSGDLFYADLLTLPWSYVALGCLYSLTWSLAALALGLSFTLIARPGSLRGAELRSS